METPTFFFFWTPKSPESAQTAAHVTSTLAILYALDLIFGINPLKSMASGFLPIKLGSKTKAANATTPA